MSLMQRKTLRDQTIDFLLSRKGKALFLSIFVHLFFLNYPMKTFNFGSLSKEIPPVPIEIISGPEVEKILARQAAMNSSERIKLPKQIVNTELKGIDVKPQKTRFLGEKNQVQDRQTIAKKIDTFKKAGQGKEDADEKIIKKAQKAAKTVSLNDLGFGMKLPTQTEAKVEGVKGTKYGDAGEKGIAQNNDFIEDIPLGDFTKLNTKEFKFYGFYFRIRQKLEQHWGNSLRRKADSLFRSGRTIASDKNHITSLSITINKDGKIVKVKVDSASGVKELDEAATESFNKAGPFPNPPKEMLNAKGQTTIKWGFVVRS